MQVMNRGLFITGTDTGVGKTFIATTLVRALARSGKRIAVMKPVASGSLRTPAGLRNEDALALMEAAHLDSDTLYDTVNPYCFEPPISPHLAAEEAGVQIEPAVIVRAFNELAAQADYVVVEGAGGWLAPISLKHTMADLARALELPVLLVVGLRLGCLNHALLTARRIRDEGLTLAGWVANTIDPDLARRAENLATLTALLGAPPLLEMPFSPTDPLAFAANIHHLSALNPIFS